MRNRAQVICVSAWAGGLDRAREEEAVRTEGISVTSKTQQVHTEARGPAVPTRAPLTRHMRSLPHRCLAYVRGLLAPEPAYEIFPGYNSRVKAGHFDDTGNTDGWQREVYEAAAALMAREGLRRVYDVGCGSGFKLIKYLGEYETVGFDMPQTVEFLRRTYPDRDWRSAPLSDLGIPRSDLVICADVIEHVPDPDALLGFIDGAAHDWIILSTPERNFLYHPGSRYRYGPPANPTHMREWSADELWRYVSRFFDVVHHEITNARQATQMIVCRRRSSRS